MKMDKEDQKEILRITKALSHHGFRSTLATARYFLRYKLESKEFRKMKGNWLCRNDIMSYMAKLNILARDYKLLQEENKVLKNLLNNRR